jgi:hypothetical protein
MSLFLGNTSLYFRFKKPPKPPRGGGEGGLEQKCTPNNSLPKGGEELFLLDFKQKSKKISIFHFKSTQPVKIKNNLIKSFCCLLLSIDTVRFSVFWKNQNLKKLWFN